MKIGYILRIREVGDKKRALKGRVGPIGVEGAGGGAEGLWAGLGGDWQGPSCADRVWRWQGVWQRGWNWHRSKRSRHSSRYPRLPLSVRARFASSPRRSLLLLRRPSCPRPGPRRPSRPPPICSAAPRPAVFSAHRSGNCVCRTATVRRQSARVRPSAGSQPLHAPSSCFLPSFEPPPAATAPRCLLVNRLFIHPHAP